MNRKTQLLGMARGRSAQQALWLTLPFAGQQVIRLATNVVLARLLAPEMFGVMVLINTLRTGVELLSDVGIGQSIVRSPHAHDRDFLNVAWTVQLARGVALTIIALIAAEPLSVAYGNPNLANIIYAISITFLLTGLQSPGIFVMQRDMRVGQRAAYDLLSAIGTCIVSIGLAAWWGNIWALVWGLVLSFACSTALTYAFSDTGLPHLAWHKEFGQEIFNFGKWVFISTAVYFAAMSTDRLYFGAVLPLAMVGIYGVARTFSELAIALAQRLGAFLVFPKVVELRHRGGTSSGFGQSRRMALAVVAFALAGGIAVSDRIILVLYDGRYHQAAFILPILLASAWFSVIAAFGESTLFGLDEPRKAALGNAAKFAVLIIGLPLVVPTLGIFSGLLVLALAEAARWLTLSIALRKYALAPFKDDIFLTALIFVGSAGAKLLLGGIGIVPTFAQWWALGSGLR